MLKLSCRKLKGQTERQPIVWLMLCNHTCRLEANLVFFDAIAKSHVKGRKVLDFGFEGLLAGSSPTLELLKILWIMRAWGAGDFLLATAPLVANHPLPCRDLAHELLLLEDCDILDRCLAWAVHSHKAIFRTRRFQAQDPHQLGQTCVSSASDFC
jgi:hypothetical protein